MSGRVVKPLPRAHAAPAAAVPRRGLAGHRRADYAGAFAFS